VAQKAGEKRFFSISDENFVSQGFLIESKYSFEAISMHFHTSVIFLSPAELI
jgi:hypothetical protein